MRKILVIGALCLSLAACFSVGRQADPAKAKEFQPGVTTYQDVIAALGDPTTVTTAADGTKSAVYDYTQFKVRPESFIPYVGAFVGGADTKTTSFSFKFDAGGKFVESTSSVSNAGAGYGLESH